MDILKMLAELRDDGQQVGEPIMVRGRLARAVSNRPRPDFLLQTSYPRKRSSRRS